MHWDDGWHPDPFLHFKGILIWGNIQGLHVFLSPCRVFFEVSEMFSHTDPHGKPGMHRSCCRGWGLLQPEANGRFRKTNCSFFCGVLRGLWWGCFNHGGFTDKVLFFWQIEQSRWFKMTFWSLSWRTFNLWQGHIIIPKTWRKIAKESHFFLISWTFEWCFPKKGYMNGFLLIHVSQLFHVSQFFMWIVWQNAGRPRKAEFSFNSILQDLCKIPTQFSSQNIGPQNTTIPHQIFCTLDSLTFQANFPWQKMAEITKPWDPFGTTYLQ